MLFGVPQASIDPRSVSFRCVHGIPASTSYTSMQTTHKSTVYVFRDDNELQQSRVYAWINDVTSRMRSNRLQLNTAKAEVVLLASVHLQHQIPADLLTVHEFGHRSGTQ